MPDHGLDHPRPASHAAAKAALRAEIRARLKGLSPAQRMTASAAACALLRRQVLWQDARSILFYAPLAGEVDVWPLLTEALAAGKVAALPKFSAATGRYVVGRVDDLERDVEPGHMGIREPAAFCSEGSLKLDLILVPGVGFDWHCRRLGRGKGFYDQLLAAASGTTIGVAFDEQMVPEIPVEPHDVPLSCILTPTRWVQR